MLLPPAAARQAIPALESFKGIRRGLAVVDAQTGLVTSVNLAFAEMHGGRVEEFEGRSLSSLVAATDTAAPDLSARYSPIAGFVQATSEHVRLDGTTFPVEAEVTTTDGPDGRPLHRLVSIEDLGERRAVDASRREAAEMLEAAFFEAPNGVAIIALDGHFLRVNAGLCAMLGRTESELVGHSTAECSHPDDMALTRAAYADLDVAREPVTVEKRYLRPDGEVVWAFCRGIAVRDESGAARYIVSHLQDITARKRAEQQEAEATARFEAAFAAAPIGMVLAALDGRFLRVNHRLSQILDYPEDELVGMRFQELTHPDDLDTSVTQVQQLLAGEITRYAVEKRYLKAGGDVIWVRLAGSLVRDAQGAPAHFVGHVEDISERREMQEALQRVADHDALTGLWNRRRFEEELGHQIDRCQRYGERAALLVVDLDGFKLVNDGHGHRAGDDLLKLVATAMSGRLRSSDRVARLGGDEFAVLALSVGPEDLSQLAAAMADCVASTQLELGDERVGVTASIGTVLLDAGSSGLDDAMSVADAAMYVVKAATHQGTPA